MDRRSVSIEWRDRSDYLGERLLGDPSAVAEVLAAVERRAPVHQTPTGPEYDAASILTTSP